MWLELPRPVRSRRLFYGVRCLLMLAAVMPLVVPLLERFQPTGTIGIVMRRLYGFQCHQRAARSLALGDVVLPVCSRCLGIYFGIGLAALVDRPRLRSDPFKAWILVGALVLLLDVASDWVGLRPPNAWFRGATGAFVAYGIALAIIGSVRPRRG